MFVILFHSWKLKCWVCVFCFWTECDGAHSSTRMSFSILVQHFRNLWMIPYRSQHSTHWINAPGTFLILFFIHLSQSNSLRQMYDRWPHELDVNRVFITNYTLKYTYRKSQLKHSEFFFLEKRTIVFKCACFILNYSIFNWLLFEQFRKPNMHYTYGNNSYSFFSLSHSAAARTFAIQVICTSMRIAGGLLTIDHIQLTATFTTNQKSITR